MAPLDAVKSMATDSLSSIPPCRKSVSVLAVVIVEMMALMIVVVVMAVLIAVRFALQGIVHRHEGICS